MEAISSNDFASQNTLRDPISFYSQLRERGPLSALTFGDMRVWIIATTYDETAELLKDPRFVKDMYNALPKGTAQPLQQYGDTMRLLSQNMLGTDPPDHTRLRGLVSKAFTPRMIDQLRPRIQQITDELLDTVQGQGKMDIVVDFAYPLPMTVISEMLGISLEDRAQFRTWTQELLNAFVTPGQQAKAIEVGDNFINFIRALVVAKREHPAEDLISSLLRVEEQGDRLSEDELVSMIWLLIVAGHETTVNLLSNGVMTLLQHPEQIQLLQQNPALVSSTVEELLRYTGPVLFAGARWAGEDISIHGQTIRKGEMVRISAIAADTDPQQFTDPEKLDITRQVNKHLAFGRGIHACLGAPLARLEGQIAIGTLFQRLPNLRMACEPEQLTWNSIPNLRGLQSLPVTF